MPANVTALLMQAAPGEELQCQAGNFAWEYDGWLVERGVITYLAAQTLPAARTMQDWLHTIHRAAEVEGAKRVILPWQQPRLTLVGDPSQPLPGTPVES